MFYRPSFQKNSKNLFIENPKIPLADHFDIDICLFYAFYFSFWYFIHVSIKIINSKHYLLLAYLLEELALFAEDMFYTRFVFRRVKKTSKIP